MLSNATHKQPSAQARAEGHPWCEANHGYLHASLRPLTGACNCSWARRDGSVACLCTAHNRSACYRRCCTPSLSEPLRLAVVVSTYTTTPNFLARLQLAQAQLASANITDFFVAYLYGDGAGDRCPEPRQSSHHDQAELWPSQEPRLNLSRAASSSVTLSKEVQRLITAGRVRADVDGGRLPRAGARPERTKQLRALQEAIGPGAVWCLDPWRFEGLWPGYFDTLRALPGRREHPKYDHSAAVSGFNWAWVGCDLHALAGLELNLLPQMRLQQLQGAGGRQIDYVWALDWDVGWVGDLGGVLRAFDAAPAELLTTRAAVPIRDNTSGYRQFGLRNYLAASQVHQALLAPARYSLRFTTAVRELVARGKQAFCETRPASLCVGQPGWCAMRGMQELRPDLFADGYSCCADFGADDLARARTAWEGMPQFSRPPGQLVHRLRD